MAIMTSLHCNDFVYPNHASMRGRSSNFGGAGWHRKTEASRGGPKTGCGLLSKWPAPQGQPSTTTEESYVQAEASARRIKAGIWGDAEGEHFSYSDRKRAKQNSKLIFTRVRALW